MGAERDRVAGFGRLEDGFADLIRGRHGAVASVGDVLRDFAARGRR